MVERDDRVRPGLGEVLRALHLHAVDRAQQDGKDGAQGAHGVVLQIRAVTTRLATPISRNSCGSVTP